MQRFSVLLVGKYIVALVTISRKINWETITWNVARTRSLKAANDTRPEDMSKHHQNIDIHQRNVGPE